MRIVVPFSFWVLLAVKPEYGDAFVPPNLVPYYNARSRNDVLNDDPWHQGFDDDLLRASEDLTKQQQNRSRRSWRFWATPTSNADSDNTSSDTSNPLSSSNISGPNARRIRAAYLSWCQKFGKTPDESRYPQFASNFQVMESIARQRGNEIHLNEYADYTGEEYEEVAKRAETVRREQAAKAAQLAKIRAENEARGIFEAEAEEAQARAEAMAKRKAAEMELRRRKEQADKEAAEARKAVAEAEILRKAAEVQRQKQEALRKLAVKSPSTTQTVSQQPAAKADAGVKIKGDSNVDAPPSSALNSPRTDSETKAETESSQQPQPIAPSPVTSTTGPSSSAQGTSSPIDKLKSAEPLSKEKPDVPLETSTTSNPQPQRSATTPTTPVSTTPPILESTPQSKAQPKSPPATNQGSSSTFAAQSSRSPTTPSKPTPGVDISNATTPISSTTTNKLPESPSPSSKSLSLQQRGDSLKSTSPTANNAEASELERLRTEYVEWCQKYSRTPEDTRFRIFVDRYKMLQSFSKETGVALKLNEHADRTEDEYAMIANTATPDKQEKMASMAAEQAKRVDEGLHKEMAKKAEEDKQQQLQSQAKKSAEENRLRLELEAKRKAAEALLKAKAEAREMAAEAARRKAEEERLRVETIAKEKAEERLRLETEAKKKAEEERLRLEAEAKKKAEEERIRRAILNRRAEDLSMSQEQLAETQVHLSNLLGEQNSKLDTEEQQLFEARNKAVQKALLAREEYERRRAKAAAMMEQEVLADETKLLTVLVQEQQRIKELEAAELDARAVKIAVLNERALQRLEAEHQESVDQDRLLNILAKQKDLLHQQALRLDIKRKEVVQSWHEVLKLRAMDRLEAKQQEILDQERLVNIFHEQKVVQEKQSKNQDQARKAAVQAWHQEQARIAEERERLRLEAEAKKKAEEERLRLEAEAKKKAEEERLRLEAEAKKKAEEERLRLEAEAEAKKQAEEERLRLEAEAKKQAEEERLEAEAEAKKRAEEERLRLEAEAKKKAEEERLRLEAEAKKTAEDERLRLEAEAKKKAEEERLRLEAEAKKAEEETLRLEAKAEAKKRTEEDRLRLEEEATRKEAKEKEEKARLEAEAKKRALQEEAKRAAAEAKAKRIAEQQEKQRSAEEARAKRIAEEQAKRKFEEEQRQERLKAAADAKKKAEQEQALNTAKEAKKKAVQNAETKQEALQDGLVKLAALQAKQKAQQEAKKKPPSPKEASDPPYVNVSEKKADQVPNIEQDDMRIPASETSGKKLPIVTTETDTVTEGIRSGVASDEDVSEKVKEDATASKNVSDASADGDDDAKSVEKDETAVEAKTEEEEALKKENEKRKKEEEDLRVRSAYLDWCIKFNKKPDMSRIPQFRSNFLLIEGVAKEEGKEIKLNEYADCTPAEYEKEMKAKEEAKKKEEEELLKKEQDEAVVSGALTGDRPRVKPPSSSTLEEDSVVTSGTDGPAPSGKDKIESLTGEWWKSSPVVDPGTVGKEPDEEWWKDLEGLDESMLGMEKGRRSGGGDSGADERFLSGGGVAGISEADQAVIASADDPDTRRRVRSSYSNWCKMHNKEPDEGRFPKFKSNYLIMERMAMEQGREVTLNEFADCTPEEYRKANQTPKGETRVAESGSERKERVRREREEKDQRLERLRIEQEEQAARSKKISERRRNVTAAPRQSASDVEIDETAAVAAVERLALRKAEEAARRVAEARKRNGASVAARAKERAMERKDNRIRRQELSSDNSVAKMDATRTQRQETLDAQAAKRSQEMRMKSDRTARRPRSQPQRNLDRVVPLEEERLQEERLESGGERAFDQERSSSFVRDDNNEGSYTRARPSVDPEASQPRVKPPPSQSRGPRAFPPRPSFTSPQSLDKNNNDTGPTPTSDERFLDEETWRDPYNGNDPDAGPSRFKQNIMKLRRDMDPEYGTAFRDRSQGVSSDGFMQLESEEALIEAFEDMASFGNTQYTSPGNYGSDFEAPPESSNDYDGSYFMDMPSEDGPGPDVSPQSHSDLRDSSYSDRWSDEPDLGIASRRMDDASSSDRDWSAPSRDNGESYSRRGSMPNQGGSSYLDNLSKPRGDGAPSSSYLNDLSRSQSSSSSSPSSRIGNEFPERIRAAYSDWCQYYDKPYNEGRLRIFAANFLAVEKYHRETGVSLILNELADMTSEEYQNRKMQ